MFKPAPMRWVRILLLDDDLENLTRELHEAGLVQLTESPAPGDMSRHRTKELEADSAGLAARVEKMVNLLEEAASARAERGSFVSRITGMLKGSPAPEPRRIEDRSIEAAVDWCRERVDQLAPRLDGLGETLRNARDGREKLEGDLELVRDLLPLRAPLQSFRDSELTSASFFYISAERFGGFESACRENIDPVYIRVISGTTDQLVMVMTLAEDRAKALTQIHRYEGEMVDLPDYEGSPAEAEEEILKKMAELDRRIEEITDEVYGIATEHLEEMRVVSEVLAVARNRTEGMKLLSRSERVVLLSGWVPERDMERLDTIVSSCTGGRFHLQSGSPKAEDYTKVPVSFDNRWPFNTFEWITKMYGMPSYREVDPTPLLAPTFAVFFGTCLSDAGYGLILALLGFFVLRKMWGERMGTSLMICGLATILMGWLFGGFFGNILYSEDYGPKISLFKAGWVDPLEAKGAVSVLSLALLMGIFHLMLGHLTAVMVSARQGRLLNGLVTHIGWCFTLAFGSIFVLWYLNLTEANATWQAISTWGMVAGILMGVLGYVWEKSGSARATAPAQFLYDILGHVADVISYSRLLALGISSAVNAFLIDLIIFKFAWPSFSGTPLSVIVSILLAVVLSIGFVLLHLVNMGLNCLSGFVHTMRLHFAEYFGKFYESGADEFIPFKSERSLTVVVEASS